MKKEKEIRIRILDFDKEYEKDLKKGKVIDITNTDVFNKDDKYKRFEDGILSPLFNTDMSDENAFEDRYSCDCKELQGKVLEGEFCNECKSEVVFKDIDLEIYGYITLEKYHLLNPLMAEKFRNYVGKDRYQDLIISNLKLDKDGRVIEDDEREYFDENFKYNGIGIMNLKEHYLDILDDCYTKDKFDKYEELKENMDAMFTQHIPIYHSVLRPANVSDKIYLTPINMQLKIMNTAIQKVNKLVRENEERKKKNSRDDLLEISKNLYKAQKKMAIIFNDSMDMEKGKRGIIRGSILGGRVDYSARNVIIPLSSSDHGIDEVHLPYMTFLELYKKELTNLLSRMENITINEADYQINMAFLEFDQQVYNLMEYMIKQSGDGIIVAINRNPTIANPGSLLAMRITHVKEDFTNYSMSISIDVLNGLNADFN